MMMKKMMMKTMMKKMMTNVKRMVELRKKRKRMGLHPWTGLRIDKGMWERGVREILLVDFLGSAPHRFRPWAFFCDSQ